MLKGGVIASLPWLTALLRTPLGGFMCGRMSIRLGRIADDRGVIMVKYGCSAWQLPFTSWQKMRAQPSES
jgi:hypothetical protein